MLAIEPGTAVLDEVPEKWALMFRGPVAKGERIPVMGDWWTSVVDHRMGRELLQKVKKEGDDRGLLEVLAEGGDKFGESVGVRKDAHDRLCEPSGDFKHDGSGDCEGRCAKIRR